MIHHRLLLRLFMVILASMFLLLILEITPLHLQEVQAADSSDPSVINTTPADTQDFFSTHGIASVERDPATGKWGIVTLTHDVPITDPKSTKTGTATLNNRIDLTKPFSIKFSLLVTSSTNGTGDGFSTFFYPGQVGTVGLWGGNLGIGGLPDGVGFKLDGFFNTSVDGQVITAPALFNADPQNQKLIDALTRWGIINGDNRIDPITQTQQYIDTLANNGLAFMGNPQYPDDWQGGGTVFGDLDDSTKNTNDIHAPFGSLVETDGQGIMDIQFNPADNLYGGSANTAAQALTKSELYDGNWHELSADYTIETDSNGDPIGTLTISLNNPTDSSSTPIQWSETINTNQLKTGSVGNLLKYFAMNISATIGKSVAQQQIKDLYATYTPEPGSVTMRFVDQNGMSIKDADNFGNAQDLNETDPGFNKSVPYTFTNNGKTYVLDYASYVRYNNPNSNPIQQVIPSNIKPTGLQTAYLYHPDGSDDMTFYGAYTVPYQRVSFHYKQQSPLFTQSFSLTDTTNSNLSATTDTPAKPNVGDNLQYKIRVDNPILGAAPWDKLTAKVTIPASLKYVRTTDYPKTDTHTDTKNSDGSTTVTFTANTKDSNGNYLPFSIDTGQTFTATIIAKAVTAGAWDNITTNFSEGYVYDTDQQTPTTYYTQPLKNDVSPYQIAGQHVAKLKLIYQASDKSGQTYTNTDGSLSKVDQTLPADLTLTTVTTAGIDHYNFNLSQTVPLSFTALYGPNKTAGKFVLDKTKTVAMAKNAGIQVTDDLQGYLTTAQLQAGTSLTVYYQLAELEGFKALPTLHFGTHFIPDHQAVQFLNDNLNESTGQRDIDASRTMSIQNQSVGTTSIAYKVTANVTQMKTAQGNTLPATTTSVQYGDIIVPTGGEDVLIWTIPARQTDALITHTFDKIALNIPPMATNMFAVNQTYQSTVTYQLTESVP